MAKGISPSPHASSKRGSGKSTTGKPPSAKSKKSKKAHVVSTTGSDDHEEESDEDELDEDGSGAGKKEAKKLIWDETLTWSLITHISENVHIKRGLYPPPGQNPSTASGGGKPKSDFHSELARALFNGHNKYGEEFSQANGVPAKLAKWAGKIKNRMNTLEKKTRQYFEHMGETGQGINKEDDIDMSMNSELVNKWRSIKASFPYYFEMLELIGQRPNVIRAGVGNSLTEVDVGAIMGGSAADETVEDIPLVPPSPTSDTRPALPLSASTPPSQIHVLGDNSGRSRPSRKRSASILSGISYNTDEEEADLLAASIQAQTAPVEKRNGDAVTTPNSTASKASKSNKSSTAVEKKTPAQPATSTPAPKGKGPSKKLKFGDQFAEVAAAEEQTRQKELEVRLSRTNLDKLKIEGKIAAKRDKLRYKAEKVRLAMVQEHEERMARLGQRTGQRQSSEAHAGASGKVGQGFSEEAGSFNAVAGPSNFWPGGGNEDYTWNVPTFAGPPLGDPLADPFTMGALGMSNGMGNGVGNSTGGERGTDR